jgi:hypothetical protein
MTTQKMILATLLVACTASLTALAADAAAPAPKKYRVVVIQAAGYLPGTEKPKGADAITHATSKVNNTYSLTTALATKLEALDAGVEVKQFSDCKGLSCLDASADGKVKSANLVIFAGPDYGSKLPKQLSALYPDIKEAAVRNPGLICSTLVSAGSAKIKGGKAIALAETAYQEAGVKFVPGLGLNSPGALSKAASPEEVDKATTDFAAALIGALQEAKE